VQSRPYGEGIPAAAVQYSMASSRTAGLQALGAFFRTMQPQLAHWYSIIISKQTTAYDEKFYLAFPPLSKLALIEEEIFRHVLFHCGLVMYRKDVGHSPLMKEWEYFITEQQLSEVEVTHYTINKKKWICIRLGSWNKGSNAWKTPAEIWATAQANSLRFPRVSITLVSEKLVRKIGALGLDFQPVIEHAGELPISSEDSVSADSLEEDATKSESECKEEDEGVSAAYSLPNKDKFPLLHSIFSVNQGCNLFNQLLKEMVQFSGSKTMKYAKGNNMEGTLLAVPEFRSLKGYQKEFKRDNCMLVETVNSIAKSAKCHPDEACETILTAFLICTKIPFYLSQWIKA
jgi:hypothetical protein